MLIDAHQHAFWHGRDDAALVADMDDGGIDAAWLLTWECPPEEDPPNHAVFNPVHGRSDGTHPGIVLADQLRARDRFADRFILGYCPHPVAGDAPQRFEAAHRMYDVRVCGEWKCRMLFDDPRCLELFRTAGRLGCPVVLHLDVPYLPDPATGGRTYQPNWYGGTVDNVRRAAEACVETIFLVHGPGVWREISGDADAAPQAYPGGPITPGGRLQALLDDRPNVRADLSAGSALNGLRRDPAHARDFLERYADRCLFARDTYGRDLHEFLLTLDLPADVRERITCRNALTLAGRPGGGN